MTQWNAVDRERSGWGPGCVKLVAVLFSAEREHSLSEIMKKYGRYIRPFLGLLTPAVRPTFPPHNLSPGRGWVFFSAIST